MSSIEVVSPGSLTTVQDLGRAGWAHLGVPRSGAADRPALLLANRLLGNADGAAALETTLSGPRMRFETDAVIALTGSPVDASVDGRPVPMNSAFTVVAGGVLRVGTAKTGLRTYIAFAGGIDAPLTLGSAATDTLTGLGPAALQRGDVLKLRGGRASGALAPVPPLSAAAPQAAPIPLPVGPLGDAIVVVLGPRDDLFTSAAIDRFLNKRFRVSPASNRIGLRLEGPPLERTHAGELRSEGIVPGAIQVPLDGQPILLLADHPTTGGYPVIAVVVERDLSAAAQLRPGQEVRFITAR